MLNFFQKLGLGICYLTVSASVSWGQDTGDIAQQIAPTGTLRAVINLGNPILAHQDPAATAPTGVSVDLAKALAEKLHLPLELIPVTSAAKSVGGARRRSGAGAAGARRRWKKRRCAGDRPAYDGREG